jgi:hypothetical protein
MRRVLSLEIGIEKPYFKPGAALRETKNVPRVLILQEALLAYNTRFPILPWVTVPHLASHILGRMAKQVPGDWQRLFAHPVYLLETFVDPERFRGTCYRAANWLVVGRTTGRGKNDLTHKPNRSIKEVLALPVHRRFRELLSF